MKTVISFSLPYLLSYFLQTLYGMADLFIIGQYEGVASTTAVSIGSQAVVAAVQFAAEPRVGLFTPDAAVAVSGGQYLRGYVWDSFFASVQFSFSGYFCACGKSALSFLHNFRSILLVCIPGAYLASRLFPQTLLPMRLSNAAGSLFSILVCVIAFAVLQRRAAKTERGNRDCQVPAQSPATKALPEGEPRIMNCFVATHQIAAETSENFLLSCTCGQEEIGV